MKKSLLVFGLLIALTAFTTRVQENVEFSCFKKNKATNTCHFNFTIDGAPYRFVDLDCKWESKREEVIEKAKAGGLALAKDWKIACPAVKNKATKPSTPGF